ncbi:alpha/beta hydrolase-fold protein [Streptomyces sp. NPDC048436]|uniref:alpha/beta hydrolase-fold protein n=1 Tax=Streptomyces sp. NPDC048436 TaxID=3365550 RepID=UPI00371E91C8
MTVGLFHNSGETGPGYPIYGGSTNRAVEYDSVTEVFAGLLVEELFPVIRTEVRLTDGPKGRVICGLSSGGAGAFTATFHRPDEFWNVTSHWGREARLVIGPWTHMDVGNRIGAQDFGIMSMRDAGVPPNGSWSDDVLAFLRRHTSDDAPASTSAPVRILVMGRNEWRDGETLPLQRSRVERWHLHADGCLSTTLPTIDGRPSEIDYDPADPVSTCGGPLGLGPGPGPLTRRSLSPDLTCSSSQPM